MYGGSRSKFHKDRRLLGRVLTIFTLGERRWSVKPVLAGSHCGARSLGTTLRVGDAPGLHG
jgi:hypothetical protein